MWSIWISPIHRHREQHDVGRDWGKEKHGAADHWVYNLVTQDAQILETRGQIARTDNRTILLTGKSVDRLDFKLDAISIIRNYTCKNRK